MLSSKKKHDGAITAKYSSTEALGSENQRTRNRQQKFNSVGASQLPFLAGYRKNQQVVNNSGNILVEKNKAAKMIEVTYLDDDVVNFENARQDSQPTDSIRMSSALDMRKTSQESLNSTGKMSMRVEKSLARKFKRKMLDNQKIQNRISQMHVVD